MFNHKYEYISMVCNYVPLLTHNYHMWNIQIMKPVQFARFINFCKCTIKMTIRCVFWSLIFQNVARPILTFCQIECICIHRVSWEMMKALASPSVFNIYLGTWRTRLHEELHLHGHYWHTSKTPFLWRFAGGSIVPLLRLNAGGLY